VSVQLPASQQSRVAHSPPPHSSAHAPPEQLAPSVQASFAQTTEASPASTVIVLVQSFAFVHPTSQRELAHWIGEAQLPGPPDVHCTLQDPDAVQVTPPSEQESSPLHVTLQSLPAHWTASHVRLPLQVTAHELACVQSTSDRHVSSLSHSTVHGTLGGHVTPASHGFLVVQVKAHAPASEHVPPAAPHAAPQLGSALSASAPPSVVASSIVASFFGSEASTGPFALSGESKTRVATASSPHATTSAPIAEAARETTINRARFLPGRVTVWIVPSAAFVR
jgi:hypothetical protein